MQQDLWTDECAAPASAPTRIVNFSGSLAGVDYRDAIICGDCLEVMRAMPATSVNLIITSPPYNLLNSTGNGLKKNTRTGKWANAAIKDGYRQYGDNMPYADYVAWQRACVAEMLRLLTPDGAIFYNNKNRVQAGLLQDRREILAGFPLRQIITWKRSGAINFNAGYFLPVTEQIYMLCGKNFRLAPGANKFTDVWEITQEMKNPHPAPYPEALIDRILQSAPGRVVLDPFGGSGTTAVCARRHGRGFILIEQSPAYCDMARQRIDGEQWRNAA